VLRPGGPKQKGRLADLLACLFGALLLIVAIVLTVVLPDKEYAATQFHVTYPDTTDDFTYGTQHHLFTEDEAGHIFEFTYQLPDNVASINIRAEFTDSEKYSDPDQFRIELFDPAGNPVGTRNDAINNPPSQDQARPDDFVADPFSQTFNIPVGEHPQEEIVAGLTHLEDRNQVLARLAPQHRLETAGVWTVRVTLVQANDCPTPDPSTPTASAVFQLTHCRGATANGEDLGNDFALAGFIYTFYTPCVEQLGKTSATPACSPAPQLGPA
jgi:hypothetical protein